MKYLYILIMLALALTTHALKSQTGKQSLPEQQNQEKPNVIIIYADDLGYGDLSSYGATKSRRQI